MEERDFEPQVWKAVEPFAQFAEVMIGIVRQFADAPAVRYAALLCTTQKEVRAAVLSLEDRDALPSEHSTVLFALLTEEYEKPSLRAEQPSLEAIRDLLGSLYASSHMVFNDASLFERGAQKEQQRWAVKTVTALFRPILQPRRTGLVEREPDLIDGAELAERRLASFRWSADPLSHSRRIRRTPDAQESASGNRSPMPPQEHPTLHFEIEPALPSPLIELSVPPNQPESTDRTYKIWYGTSRAPAKPTDEAFGYTGEPDVRLHYGYCHVFIPRHHQTGSLGTSWLRRVITLSPDDRVDLRGRFPMGTEEFQRKMEAELGTWVGARTALVYVHGFRVTFDEAACLAAQIGCDLEVNGIISFYSWPAAGRLDRYVRDRETADLTRFAPHFLEFLDTLMSVSKLDHIHVLAHSMGNRVLAASIAEVQKLAAVRSVSIGHLVLAAPDISRVEFRPLAPLYRTTARERVTLYTCERDRALRASKWVNGYLRIGFEPPVFCDDAVDTVSVSSLSLDVLGHGYVATAKPVIEELKRLLWLNQPPALRDLEPVPERGVPDYWRMKRPIR